MTGVDKAEVVRLIHHLYKDLDQCAGGPLHVELDDGNVEDKDIGEDEGRYTHLFDGSFERYAQAGDDVSDERKGAIKETCELILAALRQMPEVQRQEIIAIAWQSLP